MTEQNKGRRLSLVKDNAPGENPLLDRWKKRYGKAYENELLNLKTYINALERDHASKVVDLMQEQEKKRTRIIRQYLAALLATSGLCSIITVYTIKTSIDSESIEIHQLEKDLNQDTILDAYIVQKGGHKVPMYGVKTPIGVMYVAGEELSKRPHDIIDYQSIEDKLNE